MNIYSSEKVLPYVYQCIHKTTGKIYFGSRTNKNQKLPSHLDFPKYRTSSKYVKPIFDEFNWFIVAEFFDPHDAYNFEQQLIHEQWQVSKEISLNRICNYGKKSFNVIGVTRTQSEEHTRKISDSLINRSLSEDHKRKIGDSNRHKQRSEETKQKLKVSKRIEHSFLTPDGFVIENTTMKELCSQFNLKYDSLKTSIRRNRPHKGFIRL